MKSEPITFREARATTMQQVPPAHCSAKMAADFPSSTNAPQEYQDSHDSQDHHDSEGKTKKKIGVLASADDSDFPDMESYIADLVEEHAEAQPTQYDETWKSPMFEFARECKAHPDLAELQDDFNCSACAPISTDPNRDPQCYRPPGLLARQHGPGCRRRGVEAALGETLNPTSPGCP